MNGAFFLRPGVWLMRRLHLGGKLLLLGAVAGGIYPDLTTAMGAMSRLSRLYPPKGGEVAARHDQRYQIWEALQTTARAATRV